MKFTAQEINAMLEKAVASALTGTAETPTTDVARVATLEKNLATVTAQLQKMVELSVTGFEKPKSAEEMIAEMGKSLEAKLTALVTKAVKPEEADANEPIPQTKGDLQKMLEGIINSALEKKVVPGTVKGKGKDSLKKSADEGTAEGDDAPDSPDAPEVNADVETLDKNGNALSAKQRQARSDLDTFIGKALGKGKGSPESVVADLDDDDADTEIEIQ